jgi:hypothetical protein
MVNVKSSIKVFNNSKYICQDSMALVLPGKLFSSKVVPVLELN